MAKFLNKTMFQNKSLYLLYLKESLNDNLTYDLKTVPQIVHYYYPGKQKVSTNETIIPIYFTDWYQREYFWNDDTVRFNLRLELDGNVRWINDLPAGDYNLSLGVLDVGEHEYSIEITQVYNNLRSQRLFNKIWIVDDSNDITESQTYSISSDDLLKHNITLGLDETATSEQMTNNRHGLTSLFEDLHQQGYRKIILPKDSIIRINMQYADETEVVNNEYIAKPILIPTNTTIDLNGSTIKLHPYNDLDFSPNVGGTPAKGGIENFMMVFDDCIDSHLINGTLEGDYFERLENKEEYLDGGNGEHSGCITINGGRYNTLDNITIQKITGYNCQCEKSYSVSAHPPGIGVNMNNTWGDNMGCWDKYPKTDLVRGVEVANDQRLTSDYIDISSLVNYENYFSCGKYLTDYPTTGYYEVLCTFYDENKNYIDDFIAFQSRNVKIPQGAKYIRCTVNGSTFEDCMSAEPDFFLIPPIYSEYNEWNNIEFVDNRTCCNPNRYKHLRIHNCHFTRSGQSITPLAIDAEDGGATMQDLFVDNCSIREYASSQTGDCLAVGGLNFVFENNNNMCFGMRAEVISATIRNNVTGLRNNEISPGWRTRHTIRCYNNDLIGRTPDNKFISLSISNHETVYSQIKIKGCRNINYGSGWEANYEWRKVLTFEDCTDLQMGFYVNHKHNTFYIDSPVVDAVTRTCGSKFDNCLFTCESLETGELELSNCNYGPNIDDIGEFKNCNFNFKNKNFTIKAYLDGAFIKGKFVGCTFETPIKIILPYENNFGDFVFNNCVFNSELTLDLTNTKLQFNNCIFNGINYLNNGYANSEFINCEGAI